MKKLIISFVFVIGFFLTNQTVVNATETTTTEDKCTNKEGEYCIELQEPIAGQSTVRGKNGVDLISEYISLAYKYIASIIGILCVLVVVISGVQIIIGGTNQEYVSQARGRILQALLSLALLFLSSAILKTINPGFFT
jgi:hypothetical protein